MHKTCPERGVRHFLHKRWDLQQNKNDGKICAPARKLWPMRKDFFFLERENSEVNNDCELLLIHFIIYIYMKYSTLINGNKHWNYRKS